jgi:hypothetical protein
MGRLNEMVRTAEGMLVGVIMRSHLRESISLGRASMEIVQRRPQDFKLLRPETAEAAFADDALLQKLLAKGGFTDRNGIWLPDLDSYIDVGERETVWNQITNSGRDQLHLQGYGTSGLATNGFNYIGLTNSAITPAAGDTTLAGEISTNGLGRAQGAYAHSAGTNTTTVQNTFTATGTQACQAAALFNASSAGVMNHELTFTQRSLISGDTIQVTYTITLG